MKMFLLCPGQGAQSIGMGRVWSEANTTVRDTLSEADTILGNQLGQPLTKLCFEGPAESLNQTNVAQPALFAIGVAVWRALAEQGHELSGAAGLSLGEYTALVAAGVMDFSDGLRVVAERGRLMQAAAVARAGGMVAVIGAEDDVVAQLASDAAQGGVLSCANFNAPGQVVIAGDSDACDRAEALAAERGLRCSRLSVAGAFHSDHMAPAAEGLAKVLESVDLRAPSVPVWSNVTAQPHSSESSTIRANLVAQLTSPVRWAESCRNFPAAGTLEFHESAPGTVLRGLMRRIDRERKVTSHDEP
ncbi:MAG: [acyl-carrier-protein] S-malonyltransferase [Phycisphaera sp. TMED24]|nr:MAG: [acyl-carrier-protein] S-malonyltransferase [Phycisphaera sp. TMED24]